MVVAKKKKSAPKRQRSAAQIAAELNREAADKYGKTLVRHDAESAPAMKRVMKRFECTGPEALRFAVIELDARKNR